jgi:hypothetical protein
MILSVDFKADSYNWFVCNFCWIFNTDTSNYKNVCNVTTSIEFDRNLAIYS